MEMDYLKKQNKFENIYLWRNVFHSTKLNINQFEFNRLYFLGRLFNQRSLFNTYRVVNLLQKIDRQINRCISRVVLKLKGNELLQLIIF